MSASLVGSEMCIRDRLGLGLQGADVHADGGIGGGGLGEGPVLLEAQAALDEEELSLIHI
eukprot:10353256-Alexandrium_andersonii.AAC.1